MSAVMAAALVLAGAAEADLPDFEPAELRFAVASECRGHLAQIVAEARGDGFEAAEGPYEIAPGDVRAHRIRADGAGHRIEEYRCEEARLSARSWRRSMAGAEEEFTVESVARRAEWLKQGRGQQQ